MFWCVIMKNITIIGELATGIGEATGFTQLDWARNAFLSRLGIDAYPGTVNIVLRDDVQRDNWRLVKENPGIVLPPPRPDWCSSRCFPAVIAGKIDAAIVLPDIDTYPADKIELIAPVNVRETLGIEDGDVVSIEVRGA